MAATDPVQAAMDALDCGPMVNQSKTLCDAHGSALWHYDDGVCSAAVRAVAAARPLIEAQALREAADSLYGDERANGDHWHPLSVASWLRERADDLEAGR